MGEHPVDVAREPRSDHVVGGAVEHRPGQAGELCGVVLQIGVEVDDGCRVEGCRLGQASTHGRAQAEVAWLRDDHRTGILRLLRRAVRGAVVDDEGDDAVTLHGTGQPPDHLGDGRFLVVHGDHRDDRSVPAGDVRLRPGREPARKPEPSPVAGLRALQGVCANHQRVRGLDGVCRQGDGERLRGRDAESDHRCSGRRLVGAEATRGDGHRLGGNRRGGDGDGLPRGQADARDPRDLPHDGGLECPGQDRGRQRSTARQAYAGTLSAQTARPDHTGECGAEGDTGHEQAPASVRHQHLGGGDRGEAEDGEDVGGAESERGRCHRVHRECRAAHDAGDPQCLAHTQGQDVVAEQRDVQRGPGLTGRQAGQRSPPRPRPQPEGTRIREQRQGQPRRVGEQRGHDPAHGPGLDGIGEVDDRCEQNCDAQHEARHAQGRVTLPSHGR